MVGRWFTRKAFGRPGRCVVTSSSLPHTDHRAALHHKHTPHTPPILIFFFFTDPATTEIYTLSLHDALPISAGSPTYSRSLRSDSVIGGAHVTSSDRKSTRLNSSHGSISYAVFCLKKKK